MSPDDSTRLEGRAGVIECSMVPWDATVFGFPVAQVTRQPFNYTNDNPLNMTDPAGLCSINPFSSSSFLTEGVEACVQFAEAHPVATGIVLGAVAVGTGGLALAAGGGTVRFFVY